MTQPLGPGFIEFPDAGIEAGGLSRVSQVHQAGRCCQLGRGRVDVGRGSYQGGLALIILDCVKAYNRLRSDRPDIFTFAFCLLSSCLSFQPISVQSPFREHVLGQGVRGVWHLPNLPIPENFTRNNAPSEIYAGPEVLLGKEVILLEAGRNSTHSSTPTATHFRLSSPNPLPLLHPRLLSTMTEP